MTKLQEHIDKWKDCQECTLCNQRSRIVLGKGSIPCDILLVGEAPGLSEDTLGQPFVGPAGHLLEEILLQSFSYLAEEGRHPRIAFTNLVACFPKEAKETSNHEPPVESIKKCAPRLREFIRLCNPKLVVMVGTLSKKWVPTIVEKSMHSVAAISIDHPAFIIRASVSQQGLLIQKAVVTLSNAIEEILE